jgi:hypothetical protein
MKRLRRSMNGKKSHQNYNNNGSNSNKTEDEISSLESISRHYAPVVILKFFAADYLNQISSIENDGRNRMADFIMWIRPDLVLVRLPKVEPSYFNRGLVNMYRVDVKNETNNYLALRMHGKEAILHRGGRFAPMKTFTLIKENQQQQKNSRENSVVIQQEFVPVMKKSNDEDSNNHVGGRKRPLKGDLIRRQSKMSDIIVIASAQAIIHVFRFLPSLLHSCVQLPYPKDFFIEYYMKLALDQFDSSSSSSQEMQVEFVDFGVSLYRGEKLEYDKMEEDEE